MFFQTSWEFRNRLKDLAVLRAIGYIKRRIFKIITLEGEDYFVGIIVGISISLISFKILATLITPLSMTGISFTLTKDFFFYYVISIIVRDICSSFSCIQR